MDKQVALEFMHDYSFPLDYQKVFFEVECWGNDNAGPVIVEHVALPAALAGRESEGEFIFTPNSLCTALQIKWVEGDGWHISLGIKWPGRGAVPICPWI